MTVVVSVEMGGTSASSSSAALTALGAASTTVVGALPKVTSVIYPGDDTAANNIGGQTLYINGSGFLSNSNVYINGNAVPSKSFISASNLQFTTPNLTNGIYPIYVVNYDGSTALLVPGLVVSSEPSWNTAAGSLSSSQDAASAWSYSLSANGDAPITYALAAGSSLPTGVSLAANGLISGTITSPPSVDTTYTFSVVATDAQNQDSTRQFSVTATVSDQYFPYTTLLLHGDGTNNANNHAFIDSSNNNFTITRNGNATQGTFSPYGNTWSNYFPVTASTSGTFGTGQYLITSLNSAFALGTGNFTLECWYCPQAKTKNYPRIFQIGNGSAAWATNDFWSLLDRHDSAPTKFSFASYALGVNSMLMSSNTAVTNGTWYHIAIVRNGNTFSMYINGTQEATYTNSGSISSSATCAAYIGSSGSGDSDLNGYISNLRLVKGTAVYTSNFTPNTTPLTAISNTSILTCQSNRFIDNSSNAFAITVNGSPTVQRFSPFNPSAAYSASNTGGSAYMDGSTDYLLTAASSNLEFGSGDFTIDFWWYPQSTSRQGIYHGSFGTDWSVGIDYGAASGKMGIWASSSGSSWDLITADTSQGKGTTNIIQNAWNHVVYQRSGTSWNLYVNGNRDLNLTVSGTIVSRAASQKAIGSWWSTGSMAQLTGYLSNFRIVKGTALYSGATITVPTEPTTNVANTQLLMNFTNAGIIDNAMMNIIETVGTAKISTAQYKYGTGSIDLSSSANDSYLLTDTSRNYEFGTGDFTIEGWIYPTSTTTSSYCDGNATLFDLNTSAGTGTDWWVVHQVNAGFVFASNGAVVAQSTTGLTANQWSHFAITRSGSTIRIFTNGSVSNTATYSTTVGSNRRLYIGKQLTQNRFFKGYLDDLRVSKGYARYTGSFTAPTSAFKDR